MVARPILSIPKDQPDIGGGRDYAPGHVEVFEERSGEIIGRYDPQTEPISVLIELVHQAVEARRRPDWATLPTCPIPEDLQAHVYAIDHRGWAWSDEDEFPEGVHVDQLRAYLAMLGAKDEDEEPLRLPLDEAIALPEAELRRRVEQILINFTDYPTKKEFPPEFPWDASRLSRAEILDLVHLYAFYFDPDRSHPCPSRQQLRTHDSRQRDFWAASGTVPRLDS
ncbi:hypothetical protein FFK22_017020 [Mycobacterium sp. KBS0706]|uniref:hypothetical protein n=1 Tax=Mycobacterium sp. KBS0706 TaxID=2578109 RepID=UPI00110FF89C|nr:hypothetical protein [Mycobacterium sp. KBS0706]TSD87544.1 hypothetical protein FFK22_017020 [Mycobacterium sp. KBS0706]